MIAKRYLSGGINPISLAYADTTPVVADTTAFDAASNKYYERALHAESRSFLYQPTGGGGISLNGDLSNVYFSADPAGQTVIKSWLESGASNRSTATNYWLLLPSGLDADTAVTVYLQIAAAGSTAWDGVNTGVAPQLTGTYGQYDNGANIFTNYVNFAGTSQPGSLGVTLATGQATFNNGFALTDSGDTNNYMYTNATVATANRKPRNPYIG